MAAMFGTVEPPPPQEKVYKAWHPSMAKAPSTTSQIPTPQPSPLPSPASLSQMSTPVPNTPSPHQQPVQLYQQPSPSFAIPRKPHTSVDFTNVKPLSTIPQDLIHRYDVYDPPQTAPSLPAAPIALVPAPVSSPPANPTSYTASGPGYTSTSTAGLVSSLGAPSERQGPRPFPFMGNVNKLKKRSASKELGPMTAVPATSESPMVFSVSVETRGNAEVFGKDHDGRSSSWCTLQELSAGDSPGAHEMDAGGCHNWYDVAKLESKVLEVGPHELNAVAWEDDIAELTG
ncbi:hypothetical protein B0T18DRAFT_395791 [Schizothecium vesticola]|uniref:Uncharacterized protein n=1 Tax=Schizothecium vesticola TaxID=314040 RepID=A0AA40F876_9PEZI|nr:hypothetical protein B0T18DRAFT_395791 [Schizothecium vesticola]